MYSLDNILVCLDLTEMDDFLIRYCNFVVEKLSSKKVIFLHVMDTYDMPDELAELFPDLDKPVKEVIKDEIKDKIDNLLDKRKEVNYSILVQEGVRTESILKITRKHDITLTLMGKKVGYRGKGGVNKRVLSLTPSSVLMISETSPHKIDNIVVRMDFTKMSGIAMQMALRIAEYTKAKVQCHYVYKLPANYFPPQNREEQKKLEQKMATYGNNEYSKFMKKMKIDPETVSCSYSLDKTGEEAQYLYQYAISQQADLVLIGSKIKSKLADVMTDTTAEKMTDVEKNIPVMIVKDRHQTMNFLEALFER